MFHGTHQSIKTHLTIALATAAGSPRDPGRLRIGVIIKKIGQTLRQTAVSHRQHRPPGDQGAKDPGRAPKRSSSARYRVSMTGTPTLAAPSLN